MGKQEKKIDPSQGGTWGLVGGTFNPIHLGHLVLAESVQHSVKADGMLFIPAHSHPSKPDSQLAPLEDRLDMINLAIRGNPRFKVISPPESAYTIDLIEFVRHRYPAASFLLVIGSDILGEFTSWYKPEEIADNIRIIVASRPGYKLDTGSGILKAAEKVMIPRIDISSSDIRERLQSRLSIKYLVPDTVEDYIRKKRLYV